MRTDLGGGSVAINPDMPLVVCSDVSPADWIATAEIPWQRLVTFGPAGFAAHARVRFIPDPTHEGQREDEADPGHAPAEIDQWRVLLRLLAARTPHPGDCYFALWDGWGFPPPARRWPTFGLPAGGEIPYRTYFLFRGSLSVGEELMAPAQAGIWSRPEFARGGTPAFVWPADHAWCVTADIDPHWLVVGGSTALVAATVADPKLDAVAADRTEQPPAYR